MAQSEEHYRAAAHSLGEGFLGSKFGQSNLDQAEVSKIHRIEAFKENAILLAGDHAQHMGVMDRGAQAGRTNVAAQEKKAKEAKRSMDNVLFLNLLDQHIADLGRRMDETRAKLADQFGEDWREQLALEMLDPDDVPQRRDGETMDEYRARVEAELLEQVRDEHGAIKPEYRDNSRYAHLVKLAETATMEERAKAEKAIQDDPTVSVEQKAASQEKYLENADFDESFEYQMQFDRGSSQDIAASEAIDAEKDTKLVQGDTTSLDNAFFS